MEESENKIMLNTFIIAIVVILTLVLITIGLSLLYMSVCGIDPIGPIFPLYV
jgi:hypothetical protein